ncbi:NACHT domain-containing protein [Rhodoferax sp. BLA1]|uniref:NACHT domain-containing protein n=1 Tax=Rhodoferax sp. BLA1 TaxID=2576062 RepID=UPI0015D1C295
MDFKSKQQLIENIKAEVADLHPLLRSVFGHLENITKVETTHGTQEKGADFVLTRFDPALSTYSHVGVVVKVGKITNDITDIERQIYECTLPRLIEGGKNRVRLSEVWVVNTSSISSNAKDKIYDKYSKQRIEFINGEALTQLVNKHADYFWHQIPSNLGEYLDRLGRKIDALENKSGNIGGVSFQDFYIEPDIQEIEKVTYLRKSSRPSRPRLVNLVDEINNGSISILEGDMGFGKSKIARKIIQYHCSPERFNVNKIIPIHSSFRSFYEEKLTLLSLIERDLEHVLDELKEVEYSILIVLDGIDEAATNGKWKDALRKLIAEAKSDKRIRVLLTTRPLRVIDEDVDIYSGTRRFYIRPLSLSKVIQFVEKACSAISVPRKIYDELKRSDLFKQLPQSPIAAALLSSLIAQNQNDLPSNLTELYSKSIEHMLGRWDVQKGMTPEKEYQATDRVTLMLAEYIVSNQLIWMSFDEAKAMVEDWHKKRNTGVDIQRLIDRVFHMSGIFSLDSDNQTISFQHRSYGEYLYAKAAKANSNLLPIDYAFQAYWMECTFFYIGMVGDCPELLSELFDKDPRNEEETWLKLLALPDYVLAGYQTEYSIVENNLYRLFISAAILYRNIREGQTHSRLTELSEFHLLWFFQRIIRHCYNYEFLRPAISQTILKIDSASIDFNDKLYALFFASCFASQLNDFSGFEYVIETYHTDKLPLSISIAIELETKGSKDFSKLPLVKNHEKRLRQLMMPSSKDAAIRKREISSMERTVTELFDKPLKSR